MSGLRITLLERPLVALEQRFWAKVEKHDVDCPCCDGCWHWTASRDTRGYGRIQRGRKGAGHIKAHRLSYQIHNGPFADALFVLHRCDNPPCVNPAHLFLGTHRDNMDDATAKSRMVGPPLAADPAAVGAHYRKSGNQYATAQHFGIDQATVSRYVRLTEASS